MSATKGRSLRVKAATTLGGAYTVIAGVKNGSLDLDGMNVDVSTLTDADVRRLQTMKDSKISLSGNYEEDTDGQGALRTAYENDSDLFIQFLPNGVAGWKAQYKVSKYAISGDRQGELQFTAELEGTSAKTAV